MKAPVTKKAPESEDSLSLDFSSSESDIEKAKPKIAGKRPQVEQKKVSSSKETQQVKAAEVKKPVKKEAKKEVKKEAKKQPGKITKKKDEVKPTTESMEIEEDEPVKLIASKSSKAVSKPQDVSIKKSHYDEVDSDISLSDSDSDEPVAKKAPAKKEVAKVSSKKESEKPVVKTAKKEVAKAEIKKIAKKKEPVKEAKKETKEESDSSVDMSDADNEEEEEKPEVKPKKEVKKRKEEPKEEEPQNEAEEEVPEEENEKPQEEENKEEESKEEENKEEENNDNKMEEKEEVNQEGETELFVGSLPFTTNEAEVSEFFSYYGPVEFVKLLQRDGQLSGKGFIRFSNPADAAKAKKDNGIDFKGRSLQLRYASEKPPARDFGSRGTGEKHTIFVGNLSHYSTEESITEFFQSCGNITRIRIAIDPSGNPRGFGHVDFDTEEALSNALALTGRNLDGRTLKIDKAQERGQKPQGAVRTNPQRPFGIPERRGPQPTVTASKKKGTIQQFVGTRTML